MSDRITVLWDGTPRTTRYLRVENGFFVGDDVPKLAPQPVPELREAPREPRPVYSWRVRSRGFRAWRHPEQSR